MDIGSKIVKQGPESDNTAEEEINFEGEDDSDGDDADKDEEAE